MWLMQSRWHCASRATSSTVRFFRRIASWTASLPMKANCPACSSRATSSLTSRSLSISHTGVTPRASARSIACPIGAASRYRRGRCCTCVPHVCASSARVSVPPRDRRCASRAPTFTDLLLISGIPRSTAIDSSTSRVRCNLVDPVSGWEDFLHLPSECVLVRRFVICVATA